MGPGLNVEEATRMKRTASLFADEFCLQMIVILTLGSSPGSSGLP